MHLIQVPHSAEPVSTNTTVLNFALAVCKKPEQTKNLFLRPYTVEDIDALQVQNHWIE